MLAWPHLLLNLHFIFCTFRISTRSKKELTNRAAGPGPFHLGNTVWTVAGWVNKKPEGRIIPLAY